MADLVRDSMALLESSAAQHSEWANSMLALVVASFVVFEYNRRSRRIQNCAADAAMRRAAGLPVEMYEPNSLEALRFLLKTLAIMGTGIMIGSSPSPWLLPVGVTLLSVSLSYCYLLSLECGEHKFFRSEWLNKMVGSAARVPVLQSWNADKLAHFTIGGCGLAFLFILVHFFGPVCVLKYWILPLVLMHVNLRAGAKGGPLALLFPEGVADVPIYKYGEAVERLSAAVAASPSAAAQSAKATEKGSAAAAASAPASTSASAPARPRRSLLDKVWAALPSVYVTREMLRWRKREILLQAAFLVSSALFLLGYQTTVPATVYIPVSLLLLGFLSISGGKKKSGSERKRKAAPEQVKVILHGKVVDLTSWARHHPGGMKPLLVYNGRDATEVFDAYHSPEAVKMAMKRVEASKEVAPPSKESERTKKIKAAYRELLAEATRLGLFQANALHEFVKFSVNMSLYFGGMYLLKATDYVWSGMLVYALAIQQFGWLSHDFSHHSVLRSPALNDAVAQVVGFFQTYDLMWWKARHNTHHVVTNEEGNDPDIKTSPLLTYIHANPALRKSLNWLQQHQHIYFLPSLCLLHVYWALESLFFILARLGKMKPQLVMWLVSACIQYLLFKDAGWAVFLTFCVLKGFGTGVVVFATHYGEDRLDIDHNLSLAEQTGLTSRNISGSWLMHQFCGAISYQIEHHLCPTMPRSKLPEFSPMVRKFYNDHGIEYRESSLLGCTLRNMEQLKV